MNVAGAIIISQGAISAEAVIKNRQFIIGVNMGCGSAGLRNRFLCMWNQNSSFFLARENS